MGNYNPTNTSYPSRSNQPRTSQGGRSADRKFVNGLWIKRVWRDENNADKELFSFGIKRDEVIAQLQALPTNATGIINLTIGTQKADTNKFSVWLDDRPQTNNAGFGSQSGSPAPSTGGIDDLPF